ncbi:tectonin domain-containing protein [Nocardia lijiangensis]|uniref:tectonin domain-containing protein n=1 Tax=Nocardia lijiangensis TaxID=299618 RepID=UPI003D75C9AB
MPHSTLNLTIALENLHCHDEGDGLGNAAPYLWPVFFKIDGHGFAVRSAASGLSGKPVVESRNGRHGNLDRSEDGKTVNAGHDVRIPAELGTWESTLRPIPILDPTLRRIVGDDLPGFAGVVVVLMEEDGWPDDIPRKAYAALVEAVSEGVAEVAAEFEHAMTAPTKAEIDAKLKAVKDAADGKVVDAVKSAMSGAEKAWFSTFGDNDDHVGTQAWVFSHAELASPVIDITKRWRNEGDWTISGSFKSRKSAGLCALTPDRTAVARYNGSGTSWSKIGGPVTRLYGGDYGLFATNSSGDIWRYLGTPDKWELVGGPGATFVVTRDSVYGLTPERTAVFRYSGSGTAWTRIGGPASQLYGGDYGLFATNSAGDLWRYLGTPDKWERVGGRGASFAVTRESVYRLAPDRKTVHRYSGSGTAWTRIGGAASQLYGGDYGLFATSPSGDIWRYLGTPDKWEAIGGPGASFAVTRDTVYGLTPDRGAVYRYTGSGTAWTAVGGPAHSIAAFYS